MVNFEQMFGFAEPELAENQESEHISYGEKLKDSCCGMVFGFILFFGCLGLSFWNEYRNVANIKTINAARDEYLVGTCSPIMSDLNGKLVHITCPVSNLDILGSSDPVLKGIPEKERTGLSLESYMEVYQWSEHSSTTSKEDKIGGGTTETKTYTYSRGWSSWAPAEVSSFFNQGKNCTTQNSGNACLNWDPAKVEPWWTSSSYSLGREIIEKSKQPMAGDYYIPLSKLGGLGGATVVRPTCSASSGSSSSSVSTSTTPAPATSTTTTTPAPATSTAATTTTAPAPAPTDSANNNRNLQSSSGNLLSCSPGGEAMLKGDKMYWQQKDSNNQMIDYMTRAYTIRTTDTVSILAQQQGNTFASWTSPYDDDYYVFQVVDGNLTATQMLDDLEAANTGVTWVLRFLTLLFCIVGLVMITAPLSTVPDIIPCLGPLVGDLIGSVLWAVDCMLGCCCWSFVTAIAWITYRPIVGIPLLCVSCCLCAGGGYLAQQNHKIKQTRLKAEAEQAAAKQEQEEDVEVAEEYDPENKPEQ